MPQGVRVRDRLHAPDSTGLDIPFGSMVKRNLFFCFLFHVRFNDPGNNVLLPSTGGLCMFSVCARTPTMLCDNSISDFIFWFRRGPCCDDANPDDEDDDADQRTI